MLLILQLVIGVALLGYLIRAFFDALRGFAIILSGLALLASGLTLKGIALILKQLHPAPKTVPAAHKVRTTWKANTSE